MHLYTRFTEQYGLTTPIAQAGMAFVATPPDLAIAVTNAGGLGSLGVGLMPPPAMAQVIGAIAAATRGPLNVNLITPFAQPAHIEAIGAARVAVASFHWGLPPRAWIEQLHAAGTRVFAQVGTADAARRAVDDGVDVVVAQGIEAGGHSLATLPTFALVPIVVDAVAPALVLAAGGIADGRGLAAALMLGADGAWVGTRFVATAESAAHDAYKRAVVDAAAAGTVSTSLFGRDLADFNPMRVLENRIVREWKDRVAEIPTDNSGEPVIGRTNLMGQEIELHRFSNLLPMRGLTTGDFDEMALPAGQGVGLVRSVEPAADVIATMTAEAVAMLARYQTHARTA